MDSSSKGATAMAKTLAFQSLPLPFGLPSLAEFFIFAHSLTEGDATNTKLEAPENQIKLHLLSSVSIHFSSFYQDKFGSPFQIIDGLTFSTLNLTTHFIKNLCKISFLLLWFVLSIQILQKNLNLTIFTQIV